MSATSHSSDWETRQARLVPALLFACAALFLIGGVFAFAVAGSSGRPEVGFGAAGALVTTSAVLFAVWQFALQSRIARSKFMLDQSMQGLVAAYDQFCSKPETRASWIHAARLLLSSLKSGELIVEADHKQAWEQHQFLWRKPFYDLLDRPIEFFFGLPDGSLDRKDFPEEVLVGLAAKAARLDEYSFPNKSGSLDYSVEHEEAALLAIFNFAEFPPGFVDPLDSVPEMTLRAYDRMEWNQQYALWAFLNWLRRRDVTGRKVRGEIPSLPRSDPNLPRE